VLLNGSAAYGGTIDAGGEPSPSGYTVTLNGGASLRHVVRAVDPTDLAAVPVPPAPLGAVDVVLTSPGDTVADFTTLRNLTVKEGVGQVSVPPGTYGVLAAAGGSGFTLGSAGDTVPVVYNLQGLVLKEGSQLQVAGPVILNVGTDVVLSGWVGSASAPAWLTVNVTGSLTLNGATLNGYVFAPSGTVALRVGSTLTGGVVADRLLIRGGAALITP
jgi:hypothetical protein